MEITFFDRKISELEFWGAYFRLLNTINGANSLTDKDIKVAAYMLSLPIKEHFTDSGNAKVQANVGSTGNQELYRITQRLLKLKVVVSIGESKRKNYQFNAGILSLKNNLSNQLTFKLNFEIA